MMLRRHYYSGQHEMAMLTPDQERAIKCHDDLVDMLEQCLSHFLNSDGAACRDLERDIDAVLEEKARGEK